MLDCSLEVSSEPPPEKGLDVTSMVGLAGQLCGIVSIRCNTKSAADMASRMLGIDPDKVGPEMWDAVGEVCNLVAGNLKHKVDGLGDGCMLSVPTVIRGADYRVTSPGNKHLHAVFRFEGEPVVLSLEVHS